MDLSHVLWIGGGRESGASSVARALSVRFGLELYAIADHDEAHEPRMPRLLPDETIEGVMTAARHRFRLVLEDLALLPPSRAIVEGWQLFPTSVAAVLRQPAQALFLMPVPPDELTQRIGWEARDLRLATLNADAPLEETIERAAAHFLPVLSLPVLSLPVVSAAADTSP